MGTYNLSLVFAICLACTWCVHGVPLSLFYPFGSEVRDNVLQQGDDVSSTEFPLNTSIIYLDNTYKNIYINSNGHLSFDTELPDYRPSLILPIQFNIIAAYFADIDTRGAGKIFFRETSDGSLLQRAATDVRAHFLGNSQFEPKNLFIATWDSVGYFNAASDKTVTFQIVIASDGLDSFAMFYYLDGGMEWIMGDGKQKPNRLDVPAQAGFDSEDKRSVKLPNSGTTVTFINETNVNIPGAWMFHIGNTGTGLVKAADLNTGEVILFPVNTGDLSCLEGAQRCHINARCIDFTEGFCCECLEGFYGNGKTCLEPGVPQRLNGKVRGNINGVSLNDLDMHTYVVTSDGRAYSAISRVPNEIGTPMQTLSAIGGIIGWMFAVPTNRQAKNGYAYTGGEFNRTTTVTFSFKNRTYILNVQQTFFGHDALNNLRMETYLNGEIPPIQSSDKVTVDDHKENLRKVRPGLIKGRSNRTFRVNDVAYRYVWDDTLMFSECMADPDIDVTETSRLSANRNFVFHDVGNQVVRYAQSNKVGVMTDECTGCSVTKKPGEDPCRDAAQNCAAEADCLPDGDSYRCICRPGFIGNGASCTDVDECTSGANACSENARCYNVFGSFQCQCLPGFRGDGRTCRREVQLCGDVECGANARCVFDGQRQVCECNSGFGGDGVNCRPIEFGCNEVDNCGPNAECVYDDISGTYGCECVDGFSGDGFTCETTDERSVCLRCDRQASCVMDVDRFAYRCQCNVGYTGDGFRCTVIDPCMECSPNSDCNFEQTSQQYQCRCKPGYYGDGRRCDAYDCNKYAICDANAECVPDPSGVNFCRCNAGYRGDGRRCIADGCRDDSECDPNAQCVTDSAGQSSCRCQQGFRGDGRRCVMEGCRADSDCERGAQCVSDPRDPTLSRCRCRPGFEGDGRVCIQKVVPCNQVNNCAPEAECIHDPDAQSYRCLCRPEYTGDGFTCTRRTDLPDCYRDPNICDPNAACVQNVDHYVCVCNQDFVGDGESCRPYDGSRNYLIYAQGFSLSSVSYTSDDQRRSRMLVSIPHQLAVGVDTDCADGHLYWTDVAGGLIRRSKLDGSNIETVVDGLVSPEGVAVDFMSRNLYYTDSELDIVGVAKLNGSSKKTLFKDDIVNPRSIVIDPRRGVFYWTDWNRDKPQIETASMDGTDRRVLVSSDLGLPNGLTLDDRTQQLCWGDAGTKRIECIRSDGIGRRILNDKAPYPFDLTFFNNVIYWSDWQTKGIPNINREGTAQDNAPVGLARGGNGRLYGITSVRDQCPRGTKRIECIRSDGIGRRILNDKAPYPFDLTFFNNVIYWSDWQTKGIPNINREGTAQDNAPVGLARGGNGRLYGITSVRDQCPRANNGCAVNNGGCRYICLPTPRGGRSCACPDDIDPRRCNDVALVNLS